MVCERRTAIAVISIFLISWLLCPIEIARISGAINVSDGTLADWGGAAVSYSDALGDSPVAMTDLVFVAFDFDDTWLYVRWDIDNDGTKPAVLYDMGINITASGTTWDIYVAAQIERISGTPTLINISIRDAADTYIWNASDDGNMIEDGTLYSDPPPGGTPGTISVEARFPLSYITSPTGLIFSQFRSHSTTQVTSNVKDFVPDSGYIVLSVDGNPPELSNLMDIPDPQEAGGNVNITVNVTDDYNINTSWVNITYPDSSWVNVSMVPESGDGWFYNITYVDSGIYSYTVWANDSSDNWNSTGPGTFVVTGDSTPPELMNIDDFPDPQNPGDFVNITLDIIDRVGVEGVWVNITYPDSSWNNVSMIPGAGNNWYYNTTYPDLGIHSYTIWANDTSNNWNNSGPGTFAIQDGEGPELTNLNHVPDPQENGGYVNITVDVTDAIAVDEVWVNITFPNATWINVSMMQGTGDNWFYNSTYSTLGVHSYTVWANDSSNNWNSTGPGTFMIQDTDGPEFANLFDSPDPQENDGFVNITVDVTDDVGVVDVWLNITYPNATWTNLSMQKGTGDGWFYNTTYADLGVHSYMIWANDTSNKWNSTGPGAFTVQDTDPPELSNLDDAPDPQENDDFVNITLDVIDDVAVVEVWVNITLPDSTWTNVSMQKGLGNNWYYNDTYTDLGVYSYTVWANDSSNNWNGTGPQTFRIQDTDAPNITNLNGSPDPQESGDYVNITVDVTDDVGMGGVWVNITYLNGSWINISMDKGTGDGWYYNTSYTELGVHSYTIWANDTINNWNSSGPGTFTIQDTKGPEINDLKDSPDPQEIGGYINITVNVTDEAGVGEVWLNITYPNGSWINVSMLVEGGDGWYYNSTYMDQGIHSYTLWANDTGNNWNSSGPHTFEIKGEINPPLLWNANDFPDPQNVGGFVNITVEVMDDIALDGVWVNITHPNGSWTNISMTPGAGDEWYYNITYGNSGVHFYTIWANDTSNNWNSTGPQTFTIVDFIRPELKNLNDFPDPQENDGYINITVDVTDDVGVDEVWANITYPNGSWANISMNQGTGDEWFYNTNYSELGVYSYTIWANDTSNNWNSTGSQTFTILDTDGPQLTGLDDSPDPQDNGGYVNITVDVMDDVGVNEVWLNITFPNATSINLSMQKGIGNGWFFNTTYSDLGVHSYMVWANDTSNNWNSSGPQTFTIQDIDGPSFNNLSDKPDPQVIGGFVNITVDVLDDMGVDEVWINITYPNGTSINISMEQGLGDERYYNSTYTDLGIHTYTIWANDTNDNWNSSYPRTFEIKTDIIPPVIWNLDDFPDPQEVGGFVNITVNASDDVAVDEVWVNITYPNGTWINASMTQESVNGWYYNNSYIASGVHLYTIWANDTSDNKNVLGPGTFIILDMNLPEINNLMDSPDPQENGGYVNITVDVIDDVAVAEVWINITYPNGSWINTSMLSGVGNQWYLNASYIDLGQYTYTVWANDTSNKWNSSNPQTFIIQDTESPELVNLSDAPDPQEYGGNVNITVDIIEDVDIGEVWINITYPDSSWSNVSMLPGPGDEWYYDIIYNDLGSYSYTIWVNDTSNNWNSTGSGTFTIQDIDPPNLTNLSDTPDPQKIDGYVNITVDVIDDVSVDEIRINITYPNGSWINTSMLSGSDNESYYNSAYSDPGIYSYTVWVNDTSNNWNSSGIGSFEIKDDIEPPELWNLGDFPDPQEIGGYVNITLMAIDDIDLDEVWINITYPGGSWSNLSMMPGSGNEWFYNTTYNDLGTYFYTVFGNDTSNRWNSTGPGAFTIQDIKNPELYNIIDFPDPQEYGGFVNITADIIDDVAVAGVWINISYPDGSWVNTSMFPGEGNQWFFNASYDDLGQYIYTIRTYDSSNNLNCSISRYFTIHDTDGPCFDNVIDSPDPQENGGHVHITVNVIDEVALDEVVINITYPDGTWVNISMNPGTGNEWYFDAPFTNLGDYTYTIWARDTSYNWNSTDIGGFTIQDTDGPKLGEIEITPKPQQEGGDFNITVEVTDDVGIHEVWINITFPNGTFINTTMVQGPGNRWYHNGTFDDPGDYTYTIWAVDTGGNWNGSDPDTFSVIIPESPDKRPDKLSIFMLIIFWPLLLILFTIFFVRRYEFGNRFKRKIGPLPFVPSYISGEEHPSNPIPDGRAIQDIITLSLKNNIPLEEFLLAALNFGGVESIEEIQPNNISGVILAINELFEDK